MVQTAPDGCGPDAFLGCICHHAVSGTPGIPVRAGPAVWIPFIAVLLYSILLGNLWGFRLLLLKAGLSRRWCTVGFHEAEGSWLTRSSPG